MDINIPSEGEAGPFKREVATLRKNLEEVLKHTGEWVLIHGDALVGYFPSFSVGITEGYERFGLETFMVQEVDALTRPPVLLPIGQPPALA